MQFNSIKALPAGSRADPKPGDDSGPVAEASKNLLKHIPGDASGFYLVSVAAFEEPTTTDLSWLFVMAIVILLLVRILAKASVGIMVTTVVAFLIWMAVIDNGFLAVVFGDVLKGPWGLIVASFYSIVVTALASAGKIK